MWVWLIFLIAVGACVGSFLNVVILRLPAGQSLVHPPSACPRCGHRLAFFENVPIVSWLALRGRCRKCKTWISAQYPLIEAATAALFALLFVWYYLLGGRPAMSDYGLSLTWPVLVMHMLLPAGLLTATVVDLRYYIIPIVIPWVLTGIVMAWYPLAAALGWLPATLSQPGLAWIEHIVPIASPAGIGGSLGGAIGLMLAVGLVQLRMLPRSFEAFGDPEHPQQQADMPAATGTADASGGTVASEAPQEIDPEQMIAHPHPRREALKEAAFLALPLVGFGIGFVLAINPGEPVAALPFPLWVHVLGGVVLGYLAGGGLVWITRVLGTLAFGKEAMGLGDVHLLAAIGGGLGGLDSVFVFFIAPFVGIAAVLIEMLLSAMKKQTPRIVPFGPSLAASALIVMLLRHELVAYFSLG